jgi:hypothetical protein
LVHHLQNFKIISQGYANAIPKQIATGNEICRMAATLICRKKMRNMILLEIKKSLPK